MARSHYRGTVYGNQPTGAKPLPGAAIRLYHPDTGQPWALPVYPDPVNGVPYALPIYTNSVGELELWADDPARVRAEVAHPSFHGTGEVIEIRLDPAEAASGGDVAQSVEDHEAKDDPHTQYALDRDLTAHEADPAAHSQYLTLEEGDERYVLASAPTEDKALREYVQRIMSVLDPGGAPPPPP